jgi:hypothetical protein
MTSERTSPSWLGVAIRRRDLLHRFDGHAGGYQAEGDDQGFARERAVPAPRASDGREQKAAEW